MFKDRVYEELDEISKLIEPFQGSINDELSQLPDEIEITQEMMLATFNKNWGWNFIRVEDVIYDKAKELGLRIILKSINKVSRDFFKIEAKDLEEGDEFTVDFETNTMSHKLFIVKTKIGLNDNELEIQAKRNIINPIKMQLSSNKAVNKSRMNEIADLYGAHKVRKDRTYRGKVYKFCRHLEELMDDKKLDIKDLSLCKRFAKWIILYVREGNLPALNNITRIKIMMHGERPIYSIEEKEIL